VSVCLLFNAPQYKIVILTYLLAYLVVLALASEITGLALALKATCLALVLASRTTGFGFDLENADLESVPGMSYQPVLLLSLWVYVLGSHGSVPPSYQQAI